MQSKIDRGKDREGDSERGKGERNGGERTGEGGGVEMGFKCMSDAWQANVLLIRVE